VLNWSSWLPNVWELRLDRLHKSATLASLAAAQDYAGLRLLRIDHGHVPLSEAFELIPAGSLAPGFARFPRLTRLLLRTLSIPNGSGRLCWQQDFWV
jgi:hypothetical protein